MENQRKVWEKISSSWNKRKRKPLLSEVEKFAESWKPGKLLDVGCGNGRNIIPFLKRGFEGSGVDFSQGMIKNATKFIKQNNVNASFSVADMRKLPFKDLKFDYAIMIASLHHLSKEEGEKALLELKRVLKNDGKALITVWNKLQPRFFFGKKQQYVKWKSGSKEDCNRYYYFYNYWEFKRLLKKVGFEILESSGIFGQNLIFVVKN